MHPVSECFRLICVNQFICAHRYKITTHCKLYKFSSHLALLNVPSIFSAALLASQVLPTLHRGDTYKQVEWVLLDAHTHLLDLLIQTDANNTSLIATRCARLSALIKRCTIPQNNDLLNLQQKVMFTVCIVFTHFNIPIKLSLIVLNYL